MIKSSWLIDRIQFIVYWLIGLFESKKKSSSSGAWCGTYRMKIPNETLEKWAAEDKKKNGGVTSRETEE